MRQRAAHRNPGREDGRTLLEFLVAIIVVGILASAAIFTATRMGTHRTAAECKADMRNIEVASEAMYASTGTKPATLKALVPEYLKRVPATGKYTITLRADGTVTGTLAGGKASC
jgi:Tfp pilus assembly protein PilE